MLESVEARGKHLLAGFDNGRILHSHLRMTGAWHVYAEGQAWARSPRSAWLALTANATCAVQFGGPVLELLDRARVALHPALRSLGPDLLDEDPQIAVAVRRARERSSPSRAIGEVLLDQTISAGIGNVVRCEALYALSVDPWAPLGSVSDEDLSWAVRAFPAHPAGGRALGRRPAADDLRAQGLPALRLDRAPQGTGRRGPHGALVRRLPAFAKRLIQSKRAARVINTNDFRTAADRGIGESSADARLGGYAT